MEAQKHGIYREAPSQSPPQHKNRADFEALTPWKLNLTANYEINKLENKMKGKLCFLVLFIGFAVFGHAQEAPAWNLSQTSSDFGYFVTWVRSNYSGLENNRINLVDIPMGRLNKPALVLRLPKDTYNSYSRLGTIKAIGWDYHEYANYVLFSLEVYLTIPSGTYCFRQFFDPADAATLKLISSWVSLGGDDVLFFVGDENLNYISGTTSDKAVAPEVLSDARAKLASIVNKGTFSTSLRGILNTVPYYEKM